MAVDKPGPGHALPARGVDAGRPRQRARSARAAPSRTFRGAGDILAPAREGATALAAADLIALQHTAGNHAVSDLIAGTTTGVNVVQRGVVDKPQTEPTLRPSPVERPEVEHLQERLNEEGVATPPLDTDGKFGTKTTAAVMEFQRRHGLAPDGVVGKRTWGMLEELERRDIASPTETALDEVKPVSETTHGDVEKILHPTRPAPGEEGPKMTGTGKGKEYETEVIAALDKLAADTLARPVATPAVNMDHANRVGDRAQEEVEAFFGADITVASRKPTGAWHPGSSRLGLADASTRPVDEGDILGWADYFMDNGSYEPAQIAAKHFYDGTRARPDRAEHDRVRDVWLGKHDGRKKVTGMIRSWPAEAGTGTVFLQLRDPAYQNRVGMWDLFATLVHEFLHLVTHPNYSAAADAIGGGARDILVEGMDEHMKTQVWRAVRPRIADDDGLRKLVEGPFAAAIVNTNDYKAGSEIDQDVEGSHYDSMADADSIAAKVGEPNARAAYFMGHNEALGLGRSSASEASLKGLASWAPGTGGDPDVYVVPPSGETVEKIRDRTGSNHIEDEAHFVHIDPTEAIPGGSRLHVPGIRWHTAITEDTRAQVANQHGISLDDLVRANRMPRDRDDARIPPGTPLLIPVASPAAASATATPTPAPAGASPAAAAP